MHHRLLLGSTALVSAGLLFGGAAPAKAEIEITLGGYTEFEAIGATDDTLQSNPDRGYTFSMDNEVHIQATGTSDTGVTYGSYLELEVGSGDATQTNAFVDEVNLFFSGNFGRIELGQQDGAEDVGFVGGEDAQSGTGGVDGDTKNLSSVINVRNTSDAQKVTYYTPRVAGFQIGASYAPDTGSDGGGDNTPGDSEQNLSGAVNWVGAFSGVDLTLSAVGIIGDGETDTTDDRKDYSVGGLVGVGGLSFGATWGQLLDEGEADFAHLGLEYEFGGASASVGYTYANVDALSDTQHVFVVSGAVGLMPGVTLKGDVSYNTEDPGYQDSDGADQDDTWSGVLSVQMDY
jgi:outer membrane protein OmpU